MTTYGIYKITRLADHIEEDASKKGEDLTISVYHELPMQMNLKRAKLLRYVVLVACVTMTGAANIGQLSLVAVQLATNLGINLYFMKLCVTIFFSIIMLFIVEPEKIKTVLILVTAVLIGMIGLVIGYSGHVINDHNNNPSSHIIRYTYFNFSNMGIFLGVSSYAFESISSIFSVRRTMKTRAAFPKLQIASFIFVAVSYYITGLMVYLAYGNNKMKDMVFKYYTMEASPLMHSLGYIFCATCIFNIPFNTICCVENLES